MKLLGLISLFAAAAFANVTFTVSGTYGPSVSTTTYTAPNAPFSFTFQVANPPSAIAGPGYFDTAYTNPVFLLNGVQIPVAGSTLAITNNGVVDGFDLFLDSAQSVQFALYTLSPLFSGPLGSPTIVPGTYPTQYGLVSPQLNVFVNFATVSSLQITQNGPAPTPAPTSVLLVATGLAALGLLELLRRRQTA